MDMFTVRETADIIGVCERTARSYIKQGRIMATRISPSRTRISRSAIDEFLFNCTDRPSATCACDHLDVIMVPAS